MVNFPKVVINGLDQNTVQLFLNFMFNKLSDKTYVNMIKMCGNDPDMNWMKNDMNISGDDMVHFLFELYADCIESDEDDDYHYSYELNIGGCVICTDRINDEYLDFYKLK